MLKLLDIYQVFELFLFCISFLLAWGKRLSIKLNKKKQFNFCEQTGFEEEFNWMSRYFEEICCATFTFLEKNFIFFLAAICHPQLVLALFLLSYFLNKRIKYKKRCI